MVGTRRPAWLQSILVLTTDSTTWQADELERLGADAVLAKPVDPAALIARLRASVAGRAV